MSLDLIEKNYYQVQQNIGKFQSLFGGNSFIVVDNNDAHEDVFKRVWKQVTKMVKRPITNHVAKAWITAELEAKKRT
jgi:thymidylate kinase